MERQGVTRRLAAILAADVAGYTRLMELDEETTLAAWWRARREVIDPDIAAHGGRIVKHTGDGFLAEFTTVTEAVKCAAGMQQKLAPLAAGMSRDKRLEFRMGINLGDIVVDDEDIYGDGVNLAARIEGLAEAGGICLSADVYNQVHKRLDYDFEDLGERRVKNVSEPLHVYRLLLGGRAAEKPSRPLRLGRRLALAGLGLLVLVAAGAGLYHWLGQPRLERASVERMSFPLPEKPSLAVLPFDNLSGDASQEHVADGFTEDLITVLSQVGDLFVIARNSTFTYKGKAVKVQQVAEDLGVRYVLEGSVQRSGKRLRINAQLIDALDGRHLWAERYDRAADDLFAIQDDITDRIATALSVKLTAGEEIRVFRRQTNNLEAWNIFSQGLKSFYRFDKSENFRARGLFRQAIALDPEYAAAHLLVAWTHWMDAQNGWSDDRRISIAKTAELAEKAHVLDDSAADVYALRGAILLLQGQHEAAVASGEAAVALNPNQATTTALLGVFLTNAGRSEEAIHKLKSAMRLSPYYPSWFIENLGFAYLDAQQYGNAVAALDKYLERRPSREAVARAHIARALAFSLQGNDEKARAAIAHARSSHPNIGLSYWRRGSLNKNREAMELGLQRLERLGLPE